MSWYSIYSEIYMSYESLGKYPYSKVVQENNGVQNIILQLQFTISFLNYLILNTNNTGSN